MDVSKGSRTGTTSITLEVVEGNPPAVWVDLAYMKVKASDRVELVGYYNSSVRPTKVEWSAPKEQGACKTNECVQKTFSSPKW